ncbi:MAG: hypothetical protein ACTSR3_21980, partial [Candidatus Helarchaeota archaeon]
MRNKHKNSRFFSVFFFVVFVFISVPLFFQKSSLIFDYRSISESQSNLQGQNYLFENDKINFLFDRNSITSHTEGSIEEDFDLFENLNNLNILQKNSLGTRFCVPEIYKKLDFQNNEGIIDNSQEIGYNPLTCEEDLLSSPDVETQS